MIPGLERSKKGTLGADSACKDVVWGKNKPSAIPPTSPSPFPPTHGFPPSSTEHSSRVTVPGACPTAEEGLGSLDLKELRVTHFCP